MNALPNVLLPQPSVSAAKNASSASTATATTADFSSLLRQTLPDGFNPDGNQLMPSLPGQGQAGQTLLQDRQSPSAQLLALNQILNKLAGIHRDNPDADSLDMNSFSTFDLSDLKAIGLNLNNLDLNNPDLSALDASTLSQLSARISQMLAGSTTPVQSELPDKTTDDNLTAGELAAMNALLAMLPVQAVSTTHSASAGVSHVLNHNPAVTAGRQQTTTPVTARDTTTSQLTELASAVLPVMQQASTEHNSSAHNNNTSSTQRNNGSKARADGKQQLQLSADLNKSADNILHRQNTILSAISTQQATDFATASHHTAELAFNTASAQNVSQQITAATVNSASTVHSTLIQAPLGSPQWQQLVGQQIAMFSHQGQYRAELRLHPAELGSVKISIKLDDNNMAQLQLLSSHSHVRAALEAALPALRTQLAESGIQLGQSHIGSESFSGQQFADQRFNEQQQSASYNSFSNIPAVTESLAIPDSLAAMVRGDGAVDTFV